jgi:hypothetical protein
MALHVLFLFLQILSYAALLVTLSWSPGEYRASTVVYLVMDLVVLCCLLAIMAVVNEGNFNDIMVTSHRSKKSILIESGKAGKSKVKPLNQSRCNSSIAREGFTATA